MNVWHCLESDVVTNPQDHPRFQAVFVGRTPSVTALALRDVVVAFSAMEDFSTTSSSATQLLFFKACDNRRKSHLVQHQTVFDVHDVTFGSRVFNVHCLNRTWSPIRKTIPIPSSVRRTYTIVTHRTADVVVAFSAMEDFSTTSSSATQLLLSKHAITGGKAIWC